MQYFHNSYQTIETRWNNTYRIFFIALRLVYWYTEDAREKNEYIKENNLSSSTFPVQVSCKMFKPVGSGERAPATTTHSPAIVIIHTIPWNHIGPAVRGKTLRTSWGKAVTPGAPPHMSEPIQLRFDGRRHSIAIHMYDVSVADELRF
jgi:hypothetical protein